MGDRIYTINPSYLSNNSFFQVPELNIPSMPVTLGNYSSMTDRVINPSLQRFPALQPQVTLNQTPASNTKPNKSINWNNAAGLANAGVGVFNAVNSSLGATNKTGNTLTSIGSAVGSLPIPGASIIGSGLGLIGGVANMFTNTVNKEHQRNIGRQISSLAGTTSNASSYEELQSDYNSLANANVELGDIDQWGSKGIFSSGSKRKRARREAVEALETAKMQAAGSLASRGEGINQMNFANQYANLIADGGSIHIYSKNKGKFNATKRRTGKTTEELTHSKNPLTRKRAIFAQNAAKWNAFGGDLNTNGATWDTGITYIGNGGSHEANPYEGVQVGIDPSGVPNLVEEGEVIWDDYVFSKRLKVPKSFRSKYKLGNKELSFADAAMKFSEEGKERPNDPITKRGLDVMLSTLMDTQEEIRMKKQQKEAVNQFNSLPPEEQLGIMQMARQQAPIGGPEEEMNDPYSNMSAEGGILFREGGRKGRGKVSIDWFKQKADNLGLDWNTYFGNKFFYKDKDDEGNLDRFNYLYAEAQRKKAYDTYVKGQKQNWIKKELESGRYKKSDSGDAIYKAKIYDNTNKDFGEIKGQFVRDYKGNIVYDYDTDVSNTWIPSDEILGKDFTWDSKNANKVYYSPQSNKRSTNVLRYAPVLGSTTGLLYDALSSPDYSRAEEIKSAGLYNTPKIGYKPIGNYLSYNPLDINYLNNRIMQESAATRRAIQNNSAGNIGAATAGLLALDYNTQNALGKTFRESLEYNDALKQKVEDFNRSTDMFNIQQSLAAQRANQAAWQQDFRDRYNSIVAGNTLMDQIDARRSASLSANSTNLFNSLGQIGEEAYDQDRIDALIERGVLEDLYDIRNKRTNRESNIGANGGMLTKKKKNRR